MESGRQKYIEEQAEKISHDSEQFQLTHAMYACTARIKEDVMKHHKMRYDVLYDIIANKKRRKENLDIEREEFQELKIIINNKVFHIDVEYVGTGTDEARIVQTKSRLVISISRGSEGKIYNEDKSPNYGTIREIRKLMAHELGHIVLHTDELLENEGTQGSKLITDEEKEAEANFFAEVLLALRKKRDDEIRKYGEIHGE